MHKLGVIDASFLYAETRSTPMNIASLQLLELPPGASTSFYDRLRWYLARRVSRVPFMTRRLKRTPFALDQPIWVDDQRFDIDEHVHVVTLPAPGTQRQLEALVAKLHETPLDRSRPLWSFTLIEGLGPQFSPSPQGRRVVALYCKYHHACIDGMAGQAIIDVLFSDDPTASPPAAPPSAPEPEPGVLELLLDAARASMVQSLSTGERLGERMRAMWSLGRRALDGEQGLGAFAERAPRTPFNVAVGPYRAFAFATLPLPLVRKLAKSIDASVNDVVLAVSSAGLRRYLSRLGALPEASLLAGVPVSLRESGDKSMRNQVTMLIASLATHLADPIERLCAIKRSTRIGKAVLIESKALQIDDFHLPGLSLLVAGAARAAEELRVANYVATAFNVVISNVFGPTRTKYLLGARMLTHYPVSIPAHSAACNITVQSYVDRIDLGVTACLDAVPDASVLCRDVVAGWDELCSALGFVEPAEMAAG